MFDSYNVGTNTDMIFISTEGRGTGDIDPPEREKGEIRLYTQKTKPGVLTIQQRRAVAKQATLDYSAGGHRAAQESFLVWSPTPRNWAWVAGSILIRWQ